MADAEQVVVIGAGVSGLACAYRLERLGMPVKLLEAANCVGGLIGTVEKDSFLFESGPQSFQGTETLLELIREVGVTGELCKADPRAPRYVLRHDRLHKIPMTPQAILTTSLLGRGTRWKFATEVLRRTKPPNEDESIADFVRRKFGHEILEYLVSPFVSGVYAGDPEKLSLRAAFPTLEEWERQYGSVLRGAMKSHPSKQSRTASSGPPPLCSFRRGLGTLMQAVATKLGPSLSTGACASVLSRALIGDRPRYQVSFAQAGRQEAISGRAVVLAVPAYVAARLIGSISAPANAALSGIAYASLAVIGAGYHERQASASLDGFGVLIPRSEKHRTLGIVWNSSLFPDRAPKGQMVLTSFVGGATDPEIVARPEKEILDIVEADRAKILGISGSPVATAVWKHPKALPQYNLGHHHAVAAIRDVENRTPGLFFAGNYLQGPSIGKCVEQGFQTAEAVNAYMRTAAA
jgi:protoporphyrinogen/coproporphyrinogen III oxidase